MQPCMHRTAALACDLTEPKDAKPRELCFS